MTEQLIAEIAHQRDLLRGLLARIFRDGGYAIDERFGGDLDAACAAADPEVAQMHADLDTFRCEREGRMMP